jgi:hypothetical protein
MFCVVSPDFDRWEKIYCCSCELKGSYTKGEAKLFKCGIAQPASFPLSYKPMKRISLWADDDELSGLEDGDSVEIGLVIDGALALMEMKKPGIECLRSCFSAAPARIGDQ